MDKIHTLNVTKIMQIFFVKLQNQKKSKDHKDGLKEAV